MLEWCWELVLLMSAKQWSGERESRSATEGQNNVAPLIEPAFALFLLLFLFLTAVSKVLFRVDFFVSQGV